MIAVKAEINNNWIFIISAYFKEEKKWNILEEVKKLIEGIKRTYKNPYIIIYGDFNTDNKGFNMNMIEKKIRLYSWRNKESITKMQNTWKGIKESIIDYI